MEISSYKVRITETLEKVVVVSANSEKEALYTVEDNYNNEKHVLDYNNHKLTDFFVEKY